MTWGSWTIIGLMEIQILAVWLKTKPFRYG